MSSVTEIAARGIYQAMQNASERASRISFGSFFSSETSDDAVIVDIVGLSSDLRQVKANQKVLQVDQEMSQRVLDILA